MARNKETLVIAVDVGHSMHPHLEHAAKAVAALVQRKVVHNKHDDIGLVLLGRLVSQSRGATSSLCFPSMRVILFYTDNDLAVELDGYENIVVLRPLSVVSDELARDVDQFTKGYGSSDFLDAIVVCMDMIVKKLGTGSKGNKRIYLITDAESEVKEPEEGTKLEQVDLLAKQLQQNNISLDSVVVRMNGKRGALESKAAQENIDLLRSFSSQTKGDLVTVRNYTNLLGAVKTRSVSATTLYRGDMELTPNMTVKVWVYKKVSSERLPTLKLYSDKAPRIDNSATHEVKMDAEYKSSVDLDLSIAPEQRIKAYKYGPQYVPISSKEEEALKFKTEKGLKIVGFTDKSNVPRHYFMKDPNVFLPEPGNERSILAVSCLVRAMEAEGKVAIVRCVWRAGQTSVVVGVLTPCRGHDDSVDRPATQQPTSLQQEAADAIVRVMDLAPYGDEEILLPERTVNPLLLRFYNFLHLKSIDFEAAVPPVDEALRCIIEPDSTVFEKRGHVIEGFQEQFTLTHNTQKEKGNRKFWKDRLEGEEKLALPAGEEDPMQIEDGKPLSLEFLMGKKVEEVGSLNPVQDFEALLARRDSDEWVPKAIKGIKKIIKDFLDSAYNGNTYDKTLSCLLALRRGCVIQEEPAQFNSFLEEIATRCRGKRQNDFWQLIAAKNISFITKEETPDSEVTQEEAVAFLLGQQDTKQEPGTVEDEIDEIDALLDDVI